MENHRIFAEAGVTDLIFTGTTAIRQAMFTSPHPAVPLPQISTEKTRPVVAHFQFQRVDEGASGFPLWADQHVKVRGSLSTIILFQSITAKSPLLPAFVRIV